MLAKAALGRLSRSQNNTRSKVTRENTKAWFHALKLLWSYATSSVDGRTDTLEERGQKTCERAQKQRPARSPGPGAVAADGGDCGGGARAGSRRCGLPPCWALSRRGSWPSRRQCVGRIRLGKALHVDESVVKVDVAAKHSKVGGLIPHLRARLGEPDDAGAVGLPPRRCAQHVRCVVLEEGGRHRGAEAAPPRLVGKGTRLAVSSRSQARLNETGAEGFVRLLELSGRCRHEKIVRCVFGVARPSVCIGDRWRCRGTDNRVEFSVWGRCREGGGAGCEGHKGHHEGCFACHAAVSWRLWSCGSQQRCDR